MTARKHRGFAVSSLLSALFAIGATAASCSVDTDAGSVSLKGPDASAPLATTPQLESPTPGAVSARHATIRFVDLPEYVPGAAPQTIPHFARPARVPSQGELANDAPAAQKPVPQPDIPSPPMSAAFQALDDPDQFIPPDTDGAVGPNHLVVALNTQVRIQDKSGNTLSTTGLAAFFSSLSHTGSIYAPRIVYDSLAGHFVLTAAADPAATTSAVLIGVSVTSDPTGAWHLYSVSPSSAGNFVDSPLTGFNKDWIVVSDNLFAIAAGNAWAGSQILVFKKADLYSGLGATHTTITRTTADGDFAMYPAATYDPNLAAVYLLEEWNGAFSTERLLSVTGPIGGETASVFPLITVPGGTWSDSPAVSNSGFAPQLGSTNKIDNGDTRMRGAVYRNGSLWGTHTIFLPTTTPTRSSALWFQVNPTNQAVQQFGRIDDGTGATFFAFPSIAVNRYGDALLGYSRFSASQYASANYAMRFNFDATNTMRDDTVFKAGLAPYFKTYGGASNRWGDYSMTSVDPVDDTTLWTVQEYAAARIGTADRWGTWWGKLAVDCAGKPNGTGCDSDGLCSSGPKTCQAGVCVGTNPVMCPAPDQCHNAGVCDPTTGACSNPVKSDGSTCTGSNACMLTNTCQSGVCIGSNPVVCTALDQCHSVGTCNPANGVCSNPNATNGTACAGSNACLQTNTCQNGTCTGSNPVVCATPDQCHNAGTCNPATGTCSNPPKGDGTACNDGNACNRTVTCQAGTCVGSNPVVCTPLDQCHLAGTCNPANGTCSNPNAGNGTACNDGNACTLVKACQNGTCVGSSPVVCAPLDQCHVAGTCNTATGICSNPPIANGTGCDDGNACTNTDACQNGTCVGSNPVTCTAQDQCHDVGTCNTATGTCSNPAKSNGSLCTGTDRCLTAYTCQAGSCAGSNPVVCAAQDQCHDVGTCSSATGACSNPAKRDGSTCNDGNACTANDTCVTGVCTGGGPVTCTAQDECHTAGTCDAIGGCSNPPKADGTACSQGVCKSGVCGSPDAGPPDAGFDSGTDDAGLDSGIVARDAGATRDAGAQDASQDATAADADDQFTPNANNGGCGCRTAEPRTPPETMLGAFGGVAAIGVFGWRRRKRKPQ